MCGIAGFIDFNKKSEIEELKSMVRAISHRGPDDFGLELIDSPFCQVGFGQARLSIIDLSSGGHQPMRFNNLVIVFNGEIYNYKEIKIELKGLGHNFLSESDTEVILHSFDQWGLNAVNRFIGMFAFVIFDEQKQEITILRDRAGVKPFYYYWKNGLFLFGSELKSFHFHKSFEKEISKEAVQMFFKQIHHGYIKAPFTIFENTFKLESAHFLKLDLRTKEIVKEKYWDLIGFYSKPKIEIDYNEAKLELKQLLKSSCEYRMVSDVPVGVFLSGGYDSTAVTGLLQQNRSTKLKTFTIGFEEGNNEAPFAKETAKYLGTDHHEYICTKNEAQEIIPTLPYFYDEPFADSSAIPTILVSKLAKKYVTVALSADAGDEVFCGYTTYFDFNNYIKKLNYIPGFAKSSIRSIGNSISSNIPFGSDSIKHKVNGFFNSMNCDQILQAINLYTTMNNFPKSYDGLFNFGVSSEFKIDGNLKYKTIQNPLEVALVIDYMGYLQDDILTKVDRATMSVSLEGREPLLDHRIVEFAAQIPLEYKLSSDGTGKKILKDIVNDIVPKDLLDRPKAGFSLPIYNWLKSDLSFLLEDYLNKTEIERSGLFNSDFVLKRVEEFKNGKLHYTPFIWKILMFQMWYSKWIGPNK